MPAQEFGHTGGLKIIIYPSSPHSSPQVAVKAFRFRFTLEGEGADNSAKVIASIRLTIKISLSCLADFSEKTRNMEDTNPHEHRSIFGDCSWLWHAQFYVLGVDVDAQRNSPEFLGQL